jgi:hypothetical protein
MVAMVPVVVRAVPMPVIAAAIDRHAHADADADVGLRNDGVGIWSGDNRTAREHDRAQREPEQLHRQVSFAC